MWSDRKMGSGCKIKSFKAGLLFGEGPEGQISHEAIKTDRNREGVRRPNFHFDIKAKILLGTIFFVWGGT